MCENIKFIHRKLRKLVVWIETDALCSKQQKNLFFIFHPPWTFPNTSKSTCTNIVLLSGTPIFTDSVSSFLLLAHVCFHLKTWIYASLQYKSEFANGFSNSIDGNSIEIKITELKYWHQSRKSKLFFFVFSFSLLFRCLTFFLFSGSIENKFALVKAATRLYWWLLAVQWLNQ